MLKEYAINLVLLISIFNRINAIPNASCDEPQYSLNGDYTFDELQALESTVFMKQALNFIFTGCYNGSEPIGDDKDDNDLDSLIDGAILAYAVYLDEKDPKPDDFVEQITKLQDIALRLRENGTTAVNLGDIKEYLKIENAIAGALVYWKLNEEEIKQRALQYLEKEFLGGFEDGVCKNHTMLWFNDMLTLSQDTLSDKLWALEMFDATAKIPSGLMSANINWQGNYKMCNRVSNTNVQPPISGRYCNAVIGSPLISSLAASFQISKDFGLNIGMCFSNACGDEEVASIVSNSLKLIGAFRYAVTNSAKCDDSKVVEQTSGSKAIVAFLSIIVAWVFIATIYDIILQIIEFKNSKKIDPMLLDDLKKNIAGEHLITSKEGNKKKRTFSDALHTVVISTSLYSNIGQLFRTDNGGKVTCIHGIRLFSTIWIIFGHTFNYLTDRTYFFLLSNIRDLEELSEKWYAQLIINGMYGVDTFFFMSAFLLTLRFLNMAKKKKSPLLFSPFEWAYFYIQRYWRLLPPFMIIIMIYNGVMPYYGSGPLWMSRDFPIKYEECTKYWYTYLTFTNNFLPNGRGTSCMGYLWYIPNDYQFFAISPIFLILLLKFPAAGKTLLTSCLVGSLTIMCFLSANVYSLKGREIIPTLVDLWEDVYIKPYCRASPFICGIFLGYLFFKKDKVHISYWTVAAGWLLSAILALSALFGGFTNHSKGARRMETYEYGLFFSMTRLTWSMSIGWIIFACHYGYGGVVNTILSCKAYLPFVRVSYCCYLIHPPIMVYYFFSQRSLFHGDMLTLIYLPIGFIVVTFICSTFFHLFFELPFNALEKFIENPSKKKS